MNPGKRSLYINLGLAAGLLMLAAVLWLAPEPPAPYFKPFAHINADSLGHIEILVPGQPPARLQRQDGIWRALGTSAELDPQRLRNVLNILNESVAQEYPATDLDLKEFRLDPPEAVLRLDDHAFHFGANEPLSRRRYVLYMDKLYLLPDTHYPLLSRGLGNLIMQPGNSTDEALPNSVQPNSARTD